ncbi:MAG: hypothetical protein AABW51_00250 [Nanoarchaeota archaeon]
MKNEIRLMIFFAIIIVSLGYVSSIGVSYCCEKTTDGAWCQSVDSRDKCATGNGLSAPAPTSCESTAYCKLGTCIDSQKGECMENTPQQKCQQSGGLWDARAPDEIPQCRLGCCLIGDQAAFTTQTSCKQLSSLYGLETNYRTDITNEVTCIASATSEDKGACVFEQDSAKTCKFLTQKECSDISKQNSNVSFHKDFLCSAEELGTNCGPTSNNPKTTCVEGEDQVYFLDTCGNLANIYDASKIKDKLYWTKIVPKENSCGNGSRTGNAESATCGNCDYYSGSTCKSFDRQQDVRSPQYGNNICRDLSCTYQNKKYQHGETWCADSGGVSKITADEKGNLLSITGQDLPGGSYTRLTCYNSEVTAEPCAEFRQEVCVQSDLQTSNEVFRNAACKKNYWEQCLNKTNEDDCDNPELGDCKWINSGELKSDLSDGDKEDLNKIVKAKPGQITKTYLDNGKIEEGINAFISAKGALSFGGDLNTIGNFDEEKYFQFVCVPKYAPGYDLNPKSDLEVGKTQASCALATSSCTIIYSDSVTGRTSRTKDDCDPKNGTCQCLPEDGPWLLYRANMCQSLGDCGYKVSYQGTDSNQKNWWDFIWRSAFQDA